VFLTTIIHIKLEKDLIIFGGGHATSRVARAAKKVMVKPKAITAYDE